MEVLFIYLFICLFAFSRATPAAYGGSQARGWIGAVATSLRQSHSNAGSEPRLQPTPQLTANTTVHGNAGSLTHWARAGIEPSTSWFLVGFVNHCTMTGTPTFQFSLKISIILKLLYYATKIYKEESLIYH